MACKGEARSVHAFGLTVPLDPGCGKSRSKGTPLKEDGTPDTNFLECAHLGCKYRCLLAVWFNECYLANARADLGILAGGVSKRSLFTKSPSGDTTASCFPTSKSCTWFAQSVY